MSDELYNGRRIRVPTLVDDRSRESLAIRVGQRLRGMDVVRVMEGLAEDRGRPRSIRVDTDTINDHQAFGTLRFE